MSYERSRAACVALLVALAACSDQEPPGPQPQSVTPSSGPPDAPTAVAIQGRFYPVVRANFDDEKRAEVSTRFEARLGPNPLLQVKLGQGALAGQVPAGLAPGLYDLIVADARGREGTLPAAYTVLGTAPGDLGADRGADAPSDAAPEVSRPDLPDASKPDLTKTDLSKPDAPPPQVTTYAGSGTAGFAEGPAQLAEFQHPTALAYQAGNLYVSDYGNHRIRLVSNGMVSTFAGCGVQGLRDGEASSAEFNFPDGIALDASGTLYVADSSNDVIRQIQATTVSTLAGTSVKGSHDGTAATATFDFPHGLAVSGSSVYVADTGNHRIRLIQNGQVSTLAGSTQGYLDGTVGSARFNGPTALLVEAPDRIYVADTGNNRIRLIQNGLVSTLAGSGTPNALDGPAASAGFWNPAGLALAAPRLYIADQTNHRIRQLENGTVSTLTGTTYGFADGPRKDALFYYPQGLALGEPGQLFVADQNNHRIRLVALP